MKINNFKYQITGSLHPNFITALLIELEDRDNEETFSNGDIDVNVQQSPIGIGREKRNVPFTASFRVTIGNGKGWTSGGS